MRALAIVVAVLASGACKGGASKLDEGPSASGSAVPVATSDWVPACRVALEGLEKLAPARRVHAVLDGCRPCDTAALLQWRTLSEDGGPRLELIERSMESCEAFCSKAGQQAFYGALDAARGKQTERPWRRLDELCPLPGGDGRFASAPLFALDRIARAAAKDPTLAPLLAKVELPLPPWATSGSGVQLPESAVIRPLATRAVVTVTQTEMYWGSLALARLGADGVKVDLGVAPYPGQRIDEATFPEEGKDPEALFVLAPSGMRAHRILDSLALFGRRQSFRLAVAAPGAPDGWALMGMSDRVITFDDGKQHVEFTVAAGADEAVRAISTWQPTGPDAPPPSERVPPRLRLADDATVADLAKALGAVGYHGFGAVFVAKAPSTTP